MKLIEDLEGFISSQFNSMKALGALIKLEAKLAGLTVFPLLLNLCMLFVILITTWLSLMVLLGFFLYITLHSSWISLLSVTLLNLVFFIGLLKYLSFNLKAMSFERTRRYFNSSEINEHERIENTTHSANN